MGKILNFRYNSSQGVSCTMSPLFLEHLGTCIILTVHCIVNLFHMLATHVTTLCLRFPDYEGRTPKKPFKLPKYPFKDGTSWFSSDPQNYRLRNGTKDQALENMWVITSIMVSGRVKVREIDYNLAETLMLSSIADVQSNIKPISIIACNFSIILLVQRVKGKITACPSLHNLRASQNGGSRDFSSVIFMGWRIWDITVDSSILMMHSKNFRQIALILAHCLH